MKNKKCFIAILSVFFLFGNLSAGPVITFFLLPYPFVANQENASTLNDKLQKPGKLAKLSMQARNNNPMVRGIFSTYGGYLGITNHNGQTAFPRKHVLPIVYILITNEIVPMMMAGNTIHHWEIKPGVPARMYKMERVHNETEEVYYWNVQEVPVPADNRVPLESITLLAKPNNIYVPEGISITEENTNLVLPSIFVKKGIQTNANALYMLNFKQFFGPIRPMHKKGAARYLSILPD